MGKCNEVQKLSPIWFHLFLTQSWEMITIISLFTDVATESWLLLSSFAKIRQPVTGSAEIQTQVCLAQGSCVLLSISHYARRQKLLSTRSKNLADSLHLTYTFSEKIRARHIQWSMQHLKVGLLTGNLPTDSTLLLTKQTYSKQICLRKLLSKVSCKEESILLSRLKYLDMHTVAWFFKNLSLMESNPKPPEWQEKT